MKFRKIYIFTFWIVLLFFLIGEKNFAAILWVPDNYSTIQAAVDSASNGDSVLIRAGTYSQVLDIPDRDITIASEYIFSGDSTDRDECILRPPIEGGRCISASNPSQGSLLRIIGVTLRGGVSTSDLSRGGISVRDRTFQLKWCEIDSSYAGSGGGAIEANGGTVLIENCRFRVIGGYSHGIVFFFYSLTARVFNTEIGNTFLVNEEVDNQINLNLGSIELRNCSLHDFGWNTLPGTFFINPDGALSSVTIVGCEIYQSRYHHFFAAPLESNPGEPIVIKFDSNFVHNNEIQEDLFSTDLVDSGTIAKFRGNIFENNSNVPIWDSESFFSIFDVHFIFTEIKDNLFLNNYSWEHSCAVIYMSSDNGDHNNFSFKNNYLIGNSNDGFAYPPGGAIVMARSGIDQVRNNIFHDNIGFAVFRGTIISGIAHAENNYWGAASGPYDSVNNRGGQGDTIDPQVLYTPWQTDTVLSNTELHPQTPTDFLIGFAYPNPFNSEITIEYVVTGSHFVELEIYDLLGRKVETLVKELQSVGVHQAHWQASNHTSGIYFARLSASDSPQKPWLQKLVLLK